MKLNKSKKQIPLFQSEIEEAKFWDKVNSNDYFDAKGKIHLNLPPRSTSISIRLPNRLLNRIKKLADMKDVPYQSLIKIFLDEKINDEIQVLVR